MSTPNTPKTRRSFRPLRALGDYAFLAPFLLLFTAFTLLPLVYGVGMSLFRWESLSPLPPEFSGADNYREAVGDAYFHSALRATLWFTVLSLPLTLTVALGLALALAALRRRSALYRALIYLPTLINVAVAGILWRWLYSTELGLFNRMLRGLGWSEVGWLTDPVWAMPSIVLMTLWWQVGAPTIVLLAALYQIPPDYYEAARIDGAGAWTRFRHITLPLLRPVLVFVVIMNLIGSFQVFGQTFLLTPDGGPGRVTLTLVQYIYEVSFENFRLGYGAAISALLFVIIGAAVLLHFRVLKNES